MSRIAWLLNLDADDELRDGQAYRRSSATSARARRYAERVGALAAPDDVIVDDGAVPESLAAGFLGQAWCPTPRALAVLQRAGATRPPAPPLAVLRRVNSREFCAALGQPLENARFITDLTDLEAYLTALASEPTRAAHIWVVKSAFGFAGRGQRRLRLPMRDEVTRRWLAAALAGGDGVQVEPWVERERDFGLHGWLDADGAVHLGAPTVQVCNARGAWGGSRPALRADFEAAEHAALGTMAEHAASALHAAGYFGPFGVDAYRWRDAEGRARFNPCCEINARFSMGWPIGMHGFRPRFPA